MTETVNVTIRAPEIGIDIKHDSVAPGMEINQPISTNILANTAKENKLIEIESTGPVAILGVITGSNYIDAFHARMLPPSDCNTKFVVPHYDDPSDPLSVSMVVAGTFQNTNNVLITLPSGGGSFEALNSMDTFVQNSVTLTAAGTEVKSLSSLPLVAYSGAECTKIPSGVGPCDYIWSPATPNCELGKEHVVVPIDGRLTIKKYIVRVFGTVSGTTVELYDEGSGSFNNRGTIGEQEFVEISNPPTNKALYIKCSQECVVVQLNKAKSADGSTTGPFMMPVPAIDNYVHTAVIRPLGNAAKSYVNIVTNEPPLKDLHISMCAQNSDAPMEPQQLCSWKDVDGLSGYKYCSFSIDKNIPIILTDTSGSGLFAVWVYGHEPPKSGYGYLANDWNAYGKSELPFCTPKASFIPLSFFLLSRRNINDQYQFTTTI